ncbi:MAG: Asp23/Gls24 family envelope stress response protein [Oscillospiraceae bacterium]|nr:Asp23/Gls24 family envelope stress response protein [Oscillospiraceae bacterium]
MAENKEYISYFSDNGNIHISEEVVSVIAAAAAAEAEGVAELKSGFTADGAGRRGAGKAVKVRLDSNMLDVDVSVVARPDIPLAELGGRIQQNVKAAVEASVGVQVRSVNVTVCGVKA